jgi:hypothetical protein
LTVGGFPSPGFSVHNHTAKIHFLTFGGKCDTFAMSIPQASETTTKRHDEHTHLAISEREKQLVLFQAFFTIRGGYTTHEYQFSDHFTMNNKGINTQFFTFDT